MFEHVHPHMEGTVVAAPRLVDKAIAIAGSGMAHEGPIGTGAAMAHVFARLGASVVIADSSVERGENTLRSLHSHGLDGTYRHLDVTDEAGCRNFVHEVLDDLGHLDGLVNNVGLASSVSIDAMTLEHWNQVLNVTLTGAMLLTQAAMRPLMESAGAVVNISSTSALRTFGLTAYAAAKAGLVALTRESAFAFGRSGVRVNCISPGAIYASMSVRSSDGLTTATAAGNAATATARRQRRMDTNVLGTEGTAWDVAWAAAFLLSDEARWITGVNIPVDGGSILATSRGMELLTEIRAS